MRTLLLLIVFLSLNVIGSPIKQSSVSDGLSKLVLPEKEQVFRGFNFKSSKADIISVESGGELLEESDNNLSYSLVLVEDPNEFDFADISYSFNKNTLSKISIETYHYSLESSAKFLQLFISYANEKYQTIPTSENQYLWKGMDYQSAESFQIRIMDIGVESDPGLFIEYELLDVF